MSSDFQGRSGDHQDDQSASAFVVEARSLISERDFHQAVRVARVGLLAHPESVEGRILLGAALTALGRSEEVFSEMRVALEIAPRSATARVLLGQALLRLGAQAQAHEVLARACELAPENRTARMLLADCAELGPVEGDPLERVQTDTKVYPLSGRDEDASRRAPDLDGRIPEEIDEPSDKDSVWGGYEGTERVDMDQIKPPDHIASIRDGGTDGQAMPSAFDEMRGSAAASELGEPEVSDLEVTARGPRPEANDLLPVRLEDECTTATWLPPNESPGAGDLDWSQLPELSAGSAASPGDEPTHPPGEDHEVDLDDLVDDLLTTQRALLSEPPERREVRQSTARVRRDESDQTPPPQASLETAARDEPVQFDPHASLLDTRPAPAKRTAAREGATADVAAKPPDKRSATLLGWAAGPLERGASLLEPLQSDGKTPPPEATPEQDQSPPSRRPNEATAAAARSLPGDDDLDHDFDDDGDDEFEAVIRRRTPPAGQRSPFGHDDEQRSESEDELAPPESQVSRQKPDPRSFSVDPEPHTREIAISSIHILPDSMPPVPPDGESHAFSDVDSAQTIDPRVAQKEADLSEQASDRGTIDLDSESELVTHVRFDDDIDSSEDIQAARLQSEQLDLDQPALVNLPATLSTDGEGRDPASGSTELAELARVDDLSRGATERAPIAPLPGDDPPYQDDSWDDPHRDGTPLSDSWEPRSASVGPASSRADWQERDSADEWRQRSSAAAPSRADSLPADSLEHDDYVPPPRTASLQDGDGSVDAYGARSAPHSYQQSGVHAASGEDSWGWRTSGTEQLRGQSSSAYSAADPPAPAKPSRSKARSPGGVRLSRRRRGALGRIIASALDPKSGHRTLVLTALGVGIVVSALGIGLLVRTLRVGQQSERTQKAALSRLQRGNLHDYQNAARMLRDIVSQAPKDRHAQLVRRCVSALIPFEFGVRTRRESPIAAAPGVADEYQSAIEILDNLARGKLGEAGDAAFNARNLHPRSALLQYLQGRIELLKGKAGLAAEYMTRADQLQRGNAAVISALADASLAQGKHDEASEHYKRALEINPRHIASTLGQARVAIATGDHAKANSILDSILSGQLGDAASVGQKGWAYLLLARIRVHMGDIAQAQAQLREAWGHQPTQDPAFLDGLARLLMDAFKLGEAEEATARAASMMPGRPYPLLLKAQVYLKQGRAQEALEVLESSAVPPELSALLRARTYLALSQPTVARRELADAVKSFPELEVRLAEAEILLAQRDLDQAATLLRDLASKHPDDPEVLTALANVLLARQDPREARSLLERVVQRDEGAIEAQLLLADVMLAEGNFREAHAQLIRVTRKHSWLTPGSLRLAEINLGRRDTRGAARNLRAILKENPNDQNARLLYMRVLIEQRDFLSAEQVLLRVRGTAPGVRELAEGHLALAKEEIRRASSKLLVAQAKLSLNPRGPQLLAQAYLFEGKLNEARAVVKRMRRSFPSLPDGDASMGRVELGSARSAQAIRWLRRALKSLQDRVRQPADEAGILVLLGRAHQDAEQVGEALANYQHAAKVCPFCPEPLFQQGLAQDELGRRKQAIALLTHAARLNPKLPQTYYELGKIHEAEGQAAQAVKMYKKYLEFGPPEEFAQNVRRAIENMGY